MLQSVHRSFGKFSDTKRRSDVTILRSNSVLYTGIRSMYETTSQKSILFISNIMLNEISQLYS